MQISRLRTENKEYVAKYYELVNENKPVENELGRMQNEAESVCHSTSAERISK